MKAASLGQAPNAELLLFHVANLGDNITWNGYSNGGFV